MNAHTAGRIAGIRFARDWKLNLHLWTDDKIANLGASKAAYIYIQEPAIRRFRDGFVEAVHEYRQHQVQGSADQKGAIV
jgi:hypothetical protein